MRNDGITDVEFARKYQRLNGECKFGRAVYQGDLPDTVEIASMFAAYNKLAGTPNTELNNETVELIYLALEQHLKDIMSNGLALLSAIQDSDSKNSTVNNSRRNSHHMLNEKLSDDPKSDTQKLLTGSLLRRAQQLWPSSLDEDILSLEYFNL